MGCFSSCFGARAKDSQQHSPPPAAAASTAEKARVSQNPLSDLFVAREKEDFSSDGNIAPHEIVGIKSKDEIAHREVDSSKQQVQLCTPAKHTEVQKGLDSSEGTPTSCICDPPNAERNFSSTISHPYCANEEDDQKGSFQKRRNKLVSLQEEKVEGSLSAWLKPVQHNKVGNKVTCEDIPILGTVAAYWNDEVIKPSEIPSKWWDGNGIPNSTTKYREDQKVIVHVTPFEERLEKALSEEKSMSQRKFINRPHTNFEDNEIDTAGSQLQLPHTKSVVSC